MDARVGGRPRGSGAAGVPVAVGAPPLARGLAAETARQLGRSLVTIMQSLLRAAVVSCQRVLGAIVPEVVTATLAVVLMWTGFDAGLLQPRETELARLERKLLRAPKTRGFKFPRSRFKYKFAGKMHAQCRKLYQGRMKFYAKECQRYWLKMPLLLQRWITNSLFLLSIRSKTNQRYLQSHTVEETTIDATVYGGASNSSLRILVHRPGPLAPGERPRPAMVYFHGGGAVLYTADMFSTVMARYAVDNDMVVFNVDYSRAPEVKPPGSLLEGAAAVRWVRDNATELGVDPVRIAVGGESGGGYVATGTCVELVRQGHEDAVKLCLAIIPMVSDRHVRKDPALELEGMDIQAGMELEFIYKYLARDGDVSQHLQDPNWFPILGVNERFPPTVVMTAEFDTFRGHAEEFAEKLHQHGRLREFVCHPGVTHGYYMDMEHSAAGMFWEDSKSILTTWL